MKKLLFPIFAVVLAIGCQESKKSSIANSDINQNIVGGETVLPDNPIARRVIHLEVNADVFDPEAKRLMRNRVTCTASALTRRILITAAHCARTYGTTTASYLKADGSTEEIVVQDNVVHDSFNDENDWADIALMRLSSDLPEDFELMNLPQQDEALNLTTITAAGYGRTNGNLITGADSMGSLQTAELNVVKYKPTDTFIQVNQTLGKGACLGDSGSPAMINKDGKTYIVGVLEKVSAVKSPDPDRNICGHAGYYLSVQFHLPWIQEHLEKMQTE